VAVQRLVVDGSPPPCSRRQPYTTPRLPALLSPAIGSFAPL
jgi:hypothetical protein